MNKATLPSYGPTAWDWEDQITTAVNDSGWFSCCFVVLSMISLVAESISHAYRCTGLLLVQTCFMFWQLSSSCCCLLTTAGLVRHALLPRALLLFCSSLTVRTISRKLSINSLFIFLSRYWDSLSAALYNLLIMQSLSMVLATKMVDKLTQKSATMQRSFLMLQITTNWLQ